MNTIAQFFRVFQSRKMAALLSLGFASGLPFALTDDAFRAWLTSAKFDLSTIGWLGLVSLPYSLKFLWSPLIDRFVPPFLGRRRGWIALTQGGLVLAILAIALQMFTVDQLDVPSRSSALPVLAFTALILAFLSATQDIAIDAYRTDVLKVEEVGAGIGIWVMGYRIALLFAGFVGFNLAIRFSWKSSFSQFLSNIGFSSLSLNRFGWAWVYVLLAVVMSFGLVATLLAPEPPEVEARPATLDEAVVKPFQEFFQRLGLSKVLLILVFTIFYRFSDAMVSKMAVPFLKTLFDDGTIGTVRQGIGVVATIVGTLAGGAILSKIGVNRSLWVFGFLQAISNIGYYAIAVVGKNELVLLAAINVENFCGGMGTAGFLGFLMVLCNPSFSATQFALLSSLFAVGRDLLASPFSGEAAQFIQRNMPTWSSINQIPLLAGSDGKGWALFFLFTLVLAIPGMMFLPLFAPWNGEFKKFDSLPMD
ncbi:MFS transporter [Pseudanabaena sp. FACHB-1998]|uniref:AmpG family muropeptide MFS transporter n=1 Tax=Pseudanabaena sp. FACHB-1998 TaxID=2692858 RepID=UPI00168105F5|nr:MFS transporter [Pseudanabaena sp. FACHB-1998]MBD2175922.1 MFS transporter [Pseudanabaena sp. FACHB-1998]